VLDFLKAVLPPTGPFCVAFRTQDKEKKGMIHRVVADQHALAKVATWGARKGWDAYFCVSSLKAPEWVDAAGKPHKRKKENAAKTQMFLLDIDVEAGSQRKYETQVEALEAIEKFTAQYRATKPYRSRQRLWVPRVLGAAESLPK
jgi:FAD/FMN-containing dehydrogenase